MKKNPLVTITIPTYNSEKTIKKTLDSIKNQTYKNIEISIVDSYSKDNTLKIAKKYRLGIYRTNCKLLGARVAGIRHAKGEYTLLLDSDQILEHNILENAINKIDKEKLDMLFLEENSYKPKSWLEKLFCKDRQYIHYICQTDQVTGVLLPRFYKTVIIKRAIKNIPQYEIEKCTAQDHALIYYETSKISNRVGLLPNSVFHIEPRSLLKIIRKYYSWGANEGEISWSKKEYELLWKKKNRFRNFSIYHIDGYIASIMVILMKGIPYQLGLTIKKVAKLFG